jgi:hypothetical protein
MARFARVTLLYLAAALVLLAGCERRCSVPGVINDPSALSFSFPIACGNCDGDAAPSYCGSWRGSVCYPVTFQGSTTFSDIATRFGAVPVVFMMHGGPSGSATQYTGFRYLQNVFAKMGMVAVSVDKSTFPQYSSAVIAAIEHFRRLSRDNGTFRDHLDFRRLGLLGHSHGGGAVVEVPDQIRILAGVSATEPDARPLLNDVIVKAVIAVCSESPQAAEVRAYALLVVQSSSDSGGGVLGDVDRAQTSAVLYDLAAAPVGYKAFVYVRNGVHKYFDESYPNLHDSILTPAQHRRILEVYGSAFLRDILLGHSNERGVLDTSVVPVADNVDVNNVGLSFSPLQNLVVDNHDDANDTQNVLGGGVTPNGLVASESSSADNNHVYGASRRLILEWPGAAGQGPFRSALPQPIEISNKEVWIRAAQMPAASDSSSATSFQLGVEDTTGHRRWLTADLPPPVATSAMLTTQRFRGRCFLEQGETQLTIQAILLQPSHAHRRVAFDDLEIYTPAPPPMPNPPAGESCSPGAPSRCCNYVLSEQPPRTRPGIQTCGSNGHWGPCSDCPFGRRSCSACDHL